MKKLFIVAAKLIGLLALYWALSTLVQIAGAFAFMFRSMLDSEGNSPAARILCWVIGNVLYGGLTFILSYLLMFKTEWIASKLNVPDENIPSLPQNQKLLKGGVILLGLYFFLFSIPTLTKYIFGISSLPHARFEMEKIIKIASVLLQLGLALFIMKNPDCVLKILNKKPKSSEPT